MEKRWIRYAVDGEKEEAARREHENAVMDLRNAFILVPEGVALSTGIPCGISAITRMVWGYVCCWGSRRRS